MLRLCLLFQVFIVIDTWTASEVLATKHRCYVCVPSTGSSISDVLQMFPDGPPVPLCNKFLISKPEFIRECPSFGNQGCLTQTNGTHVTKTCTEFGLEDCKTANKIKYCYCKGDLCNKEPVPVEATTAPPEIETDDDEDTREGIEGSGFSEKTEFKQVESPSEIDLGIKVVPNHFPTTIKSVILTTPRPDSVEPVQATANPPTRPLYILYVISFLLLLRG